MTLLGWAAAGAIVWLPAAVALALLVGRAIRVGRGPEVPAPQETDVRG